jgi:hypothetical protein
MKFDNKIFNEQLDYIKKKKGRLTKKELNVIQHDPERKFALTRFLLDFLKEKELFFKETPKEDISGETDCPVCDKKLSYFQSSYNGHHHMSCKCFGMYME